MNASRAPFEVEVFFDGDCPLCVREMKLLQRLDRRGRIHFTDIAAPTFDARPTGLTLETLMDRIHARLPSGELIEGVEVFRKLYAAVGLGFLLAWTKWPGFRAIADAAYRVFAKNRLRLTGRCVKDANGACGVAEHRA